jgi:hypothetical protein
MERFFKNIDRKSTVKPSEKSWLKLQQKLDRHRFKRGINTYRNLAIAAVGLLLISITIMLTVSIEKDAQIIQSEIAGTLAYQIEDLASDTYEYYSSDKLKILSEKYVSAGLLEK